MRCFLLSHFWIKEGQEYKFDLLKKSIAHYRYNYPDTLLILTGHGLKPSKNILLEVDQTVWMEKLLQGEVGRGHPICVSAGIDLAHKLGVKYLLKNRADMVSINRNVFEKCIEYTNNHEKAGAGFLIDNQLHDITMYGSIDFFKKAWDQNNWSKSFSVNGVTNINNSLKKHDINIPTDVGHMNHTDFRMVFLEPWWDHYFATLSMDMFISNQFKTNNLTFFDGYSSKGQSL